MADLTAFLTQNVEGLLFGDLHSLQVATLPLGKQYGAVGYPLIISTFAGIELLGGLLSPNRFDKNKGREYFTDFWNGWLYKTDLLRANAGETLYQLIRHGLAHAYVTKGSFTIIKGSQQRHLTQSCTGEIFLDAIQLATDLMDTYTNFIQPIAINTSGSPNKNTMTQRLTEMETEYTGQAAPFLGKIRLPPTPNLTSETVPTSGSAFP